MVKVALWGSLRPLADGAETVEIEARDIRGLLSQLGELHPGLKPMAGCFAIPGLSPCPMMPRCICSRALPAAEETPA